MSIGKINFKLHRVCNLCLEERGIPKIGEYICAWVNTDGEYPRLKKDRFFLLLCKYHLEKIQKLGRKKGWISIPYLYINDDPINFKKMLAINQGQNDAYT